MIDLEITAVAGRHHASVRASTEHPVVLLTGGSGVGKTTVLRAVCGLAGATGHVTVLGRSWTTRSRRLAPGLRVGYVPQDGGAFVGQSVRKNVALVARDPDAARVALASCGLGDLGDRIVDGLSGGQLRRVALARALASDSSVLVLDEPFAGLDDQAALELLTVLATSVGNERPLFISSHSRVQEVRRAFSDRMCAVEVVPAPAR